MKDSSDAAKLDQASTAADAIAMAMKADPSNVLKLFLQKQTQIFDCATRIYCAHLSRNVSPTDKDIPVIERAREVLLMLLPENKE